MHPGLGKAHEMAQGIPGKAVAHHFAPEFRIGSVYRHVDGADVHFDNPGNLVLAEIGQGDIISKEEGKPGIVVLKIQALPHPLGKLVNKAENALVPAGMLPVHEIGFKFQAQRLILPFADMNLALFPLCIGNCQDQAGIRLIEPEIQNIHNGIAVNGHQGLPGLNAGQICRAAGMHLLNEHCHGLAPFQK